MELRIHLQKYIKRFNGINQDFEKTWHKCLSDGDSMSQTLHLPSVSPNNIEYCIPLHDYFVNNWYIT